MPLFYFKRENVLTCSIILAFCCWSLLNSLNFAIYIPTYNLDGAFQTASGLFRLGEGNLPGKDFFPYLGIGPLIFLYPVFKIFGSNLSASLISAQFMTYISGAFSISLIIHLIFKPQSFFKSFSFGSISFFILVYLLGKLELNISFINFISTPGNSLRPIRAFIPYIIIILYYIILNKNNITPNKKSVFSGILIGLTATWSNDFAIPTIGLFFLLFLLVSFIQKELNLFRFFIFVVAGITSTLIILGLLTFGNIYNLMQYNFLDVAKDQWWYFGPYLEWTRIFEIKQIYEIITYSWNIYSIFVSLFCIIIAIKTKKIEYIMLSWLGAVSFSGGLVASIGGHIGGYFEAFYFWSAITTLFLIIKLFSFFIGFIIALDKSKFSSVSEKLIIATAIFLVLKSLFMLKNYFYNVKYLENDKNNFYVEELGGYMSNDWLDYISFIRNTNENQVVVEEYWGLWSAMKKSISSWPVDSVIHALGRTRNSAKNNMKDANFIVSTKNSKSYGIQPWSFSYNFWFYDELLRNWTIFSESPTTIVWKKNLLEKKFPIVSCSIDNKNKLIKINSSMSGFYRIRLEYDLKKKGRGLLFLKNNISFFGGLNGYISINPDGKEITFPAYLYDNNEKEQILDFNMIKYEHENLDLQSVSCSKIELDYDYEEVMSLPPSKQE